MRTITIFVIITWCLVTVCTSCGIGLSFSWGGRPYFNRPWYYDDYGMGFGGPRFTIGSNGFFGGGGMSSNNVHHHHHYYYDKEGKYKYRYSKEPPPGSSGYNTGSWNNSPFWRFFF